MSINPKDVRMIENLAKRISSSYFHGQVREDMESVCLYYGLLAYEKSNKDMNYESYIAKFMRDRSIDRYRKEARVSCKDVMLSSSLIYEDNSVENIEFYECVRQYCKGKSFKDRKIIFNFFNGVPKHYLPRKCGVGHDRVSRVLNSLWEFIDG